MFDVRGRFAEIALLFRALPLARRAQQARSTPIPDLAVVMAKAGGVDKSHSEQDLVVATARASSRWARWFGGLNTCLTRSLVLGSLHSGRGEVVLNIGFRPGEPEAPVEGHAWVSLDGRAIGVDGHLAEESYSRLLELPFVD